MLASRLTARQGVGADKMMMLEEQVSVEWVGGPAVSTSTATRERRRVPQVAYKETLHVAPYDGKLPPAASFLQVSATNVSPFGIGFLTKSFPRCETLVLRFGEESQPVFMSARVVHFTAGFGDSDYLVGCEFLARIAPTNKSV